MELLQNILLVFSCLMLVVLALRAGTRLTVPGIPALFAMILFFIVWVIGDIIEVNSSTHIWMLWGRNIQQIGVFLTPLCTLYFSYHYTSNKRMRFFAYVMTVVQFTSIALIFTDEYTHLMRTAIVYQPNAVFGQAVDVHITPIASVLISFNFALPLIALIVLSLFTRRVTAKLRQPLWLIIISIFFTLFVAIVQSTFLSDMGINIPIPIWNLPCVMLMFYAVLKGGFLGLAPTAFHKVFEVIDQGIIVLDANGVVTEYNGRASYLLDAVTDSPALTIGAEISPFFSDTPKPSQPTRFFPEEVPTELSSLKRNLNVSLSCHTLDDLHGKPVGYVLVLTDITLLKQRAEIDPLTSVYNREGLTNAFEYCQTQQTEQLPVSAMIIDIDHFKNINDTFGHFAGDHVLKDFVSEAQSILTGYFKIGRLGGDEFVILLAADINRAFSIAEQLRQHITGRTIRYLNHDIHYTVSIGVANCTSQDETLSALLAKADRALYKSKQQGRNRTSS